MTMVQSPTPHTARAFDVDLSSLRERLAEMSRRVCEQLHLALEAFWTSSKDKMADVEANDRAVDRDEKAIDSMAVRVLALRQPAANDLRLITASLKVAADLERIGDEAVDLARTAVSLSADGRRAHERLQAITDSSEAVLLAAVGAFFDGNAEKAAKAQRSAREIRALCRELFGDAVEYTSRGGDDTTAAVSLITVCKCLDRIAHHATSIAGWAGFVLGLERPE
jgi:phosphate transport system protein